MTIIISSDEIKKTLPNYSPEKAEKFHHESAKLADKLFYNNLKTNREERIIIMGGGAASGKTEFLVTQLNKGKPNQIIFDTTFSSIEGARIKIERILKAKKIPVIYFVFPDNIHRAYIAFLHRDRKFSDEHFYRTHSGSRATLLWITKNFPNIEINIVESAYTTKKSLKFRGLKFANKNELADFIEKLQISETDIISTVTQVK